MCYVFEPKNPFRYIDTKVTQIGNVPVFDLLFSREYGEEKYYSVCGADVRLSIPFSPSLRGGTRMQRVLAGIRERDHTGDRGESMGSDSEVLRVTGTVTDDGRGSVLRWGEGSEDNLLSRGECQNLEGVNPLRVLKVDVDVPNDLYDVEKIFMWRIYALRELGYDVECARYEPSSSGEHIHYVVVLKEPVESMKEVYDLQMFLGDDHRRATYNYIRYKVMGDDSYHFNVLFRRKVKLTAYVKLRIISRAILRQLSTSLHIFHTRREGTNTRYRKWFLVITTFLPRRKYSWTTSINKNEKEEN